MTRLLDLHCDWLLQYARETTVFDPTLYPEVEARLSQTEGYLTGTSAAILACYRRQADWAKQENPWRALGDLIARIEAEFPGRLLIGPDDFGRWIEDDDGLCWGVLGIEGFDALIGTTADLGRLPGLFERGVRVFQPLYAADNALGGSSTAGDERGLSSLGRSFLSALAELGTHDGPRPALDLAHLNPRSMADALAWFEATDPRVLPLYSHGALVHDGFVSPRAITLENLTRLRALGGVTGFTPAFYADSDAFKAAFEMAAALPFRGREGFEGLAVGTDFVGVDQNPPGLGNVEDIVRWALASFRRETAEALLAGNARVLFQRLTGAS